MIPGPKVGLVIGKGGETIKMLQEKSGAKMVVIQDGPNQEAEKPLRITGDPQKVEHARQLVYELLAEKEQVRPIDCKAVRAVVIWDMGTRRCYPRSSITE